GIDWQFPHNNWGQQPGLRIAAGATRITLWARGARGGETVKLGAGQGGTMAFKDTLEAPSVEAALTSACTRYEVPPGSAGYQGPAAATARRPAPPPPRAAPAGGRPRHACVTAELMRRVGDGRAAAYYEKAIAAAPGEPGYELWYGYYLRNVRGPGHPLDEAAE